MKRKCLAYIMALTIALSVGISNVSIGASENNLNGKASNTTYDVDSYVNEMLDKSYTKISEAYSYPKYTKQTLEYQVDEAYESSPTNTSANKITKDNYNYKNPVVSLANGDEAAFQIDVEETAGYFIKIDYLSYDDSILPIELSMKINGEYPFYESRRLLFETTWIANEEKSYDRYNNEIITIPNKLVQWESKYIMDASYRHSYPLIIQLDKGVNELTFKVSEGNILIGNIYLEAITSISEYITENNKPATGEQIIILQGEEFTYRNDSSIRAVAEYEVDLDPYEIKDTVLNTIDSYSFKNAGQRVSYDFEVSQEGYYNIALNYRQSDKEDFPVFVDVAVDGFIPNTMFQSYPLDYTNRYRTEILEDNEKNRLSIYLNEGTHTISWTINIDNIRHVLENVSRIIGEVNDLSLEITKVAGTNKDKYRDLKLTRYIPNVEERLYGWVDELRTLQNSVKRYNPKAKEIAAFSSISIAIEQLISLAEEPDELPYRVAELATSVNSVNQQLANLVDAINKNDLAIDRIYIFQEEAKLPTKVGFIKKTYLSFKRFIYSFFEQAYSTSSVNEEHLQVWVNRPRQYLEIMQKMIDEYFTPATGIEVDLSLMPDPNKLILANSSGDAPDIATGINYAIPFELGIRGATKDLTEFSDFVEIANRYQPGLHIPATIDDGIYSLPETMNFWVLFYRNDVLDKLELEVPNTMDDVIDMLPELQMRGMNFYYPTAGMIVMRNFHGTTPLLFQNNARLYDETGKTTINTEEGIEGFTELTELFTIYNLPVDIPNFYQHFRNGDLPIGIADYGVYNLLLNAAPEIANSWNIALVPGVENSQGEILRYTAGGAESTVLFKSTKDREDKAWTFMKWWSSAEVQKEFGQTLQISYGNEYIWNTANLEAFISLPWNSQDKFVIEEQSRWVIESPRILGGYMLEREMSNSFNDIVVNGKSLRTRIDRAVKVVDRETRRKLEEFGYIVDGEVIIPYNVPDISKVNQILGNKND